jgi:hypothetical protein
MHEDSPHVRGHTISRNQQYQGLDGQLEDWMALASGKSAVVNKRMAAVQKFLGGGRCIWRQTRSLTLRRNLFPTR